LRKSAYTFACGLFWAAAVSAAVGGTGGTGFALRVISALNVTSNEYVVPKNSCGFALL